MYTNLSAVDLELVYHLVLVRVILDSSITHQCAIV